MFVCIDANLWIFFLSLAFKRVCTGVPEMNSLRLRLHFHQPATLNHAMDSKDDYDGNANELFHRGHKINRRRLSHSSIILRFVVFFLVVSNRFNGN